MKKIDKDKPKQYIDGYTEFYKLKFKVTSDTLIPRPETELLVDEVLNFVNSSSRVNEQRDTITILDIGTGAGNIAISIAKNLEKYPTSGVGVKIFATDVSEEALKVARQNAKLHGVEKQITFLQNNLFNVIARSDNDKAISKSRLPRPFGARNDNNVDIIVTNLPYIPTARIPYLDSSVKDFEPHIALDGGEDGFELYRKLFEQISLTPRRCKPKLIIGEIDYTHGELARNEALKYFPKAKVEIKTDLAHKQRILIIKCWG